MNAAEAQANLKEASRLRLPARDHKQQERQHREAARQLMQKVAEIERKCAAAGVRVKVLDADGRLITTHRAEAPSGNHNEAQHQIYEEPQGANTAAGGRA